MMPGHAGPGFGAVRSLSRDKSVTRQRLAPGTIARVGSFARPYRGRLTVFISLILVEAALGASVPLVYRQIIDVGIADKNTTVVLAWAAVLVLLALVGAAISLTQRWFSSRIGEGLIYDLRTQVFDHVQQQPVGVLHPHPDRLAGVAAQLRRHRRAAGLHLDAVERGRQRRHADRHARSRCSFLSWQITLLALVLFPLFLLPARWLGAEALGDHPRALPGRRGDGPDDDRALQRRGRAAGEAVRPARRGVLDLRPPRRSGPRHRRDVDDVLDAWSWSP